MPRSGLLDVRALPTVGMSQYFVEMSETPLSQGQPTIAVQRHFPWGSSEEHECLCIEAWKVTSSYS